MDVFKTISYKFASSSLNINIYIYIIYDLNLLYDEKVYSPDNN